MNRIEIYKKWEQNFLVREQEKAISTPETIVSYMNNTDLEPVEKFSVAYLDGAHKVIRIDSVFIGTLNRSLVHPREVYRTAVTLNCAAIIALHNHPSGNLEFSEEDIATCNVLSESGRILGIQLLDFICYSYTGFSSCLEQGKL